MTTPCTVTGNVRSLLDAPAAGAVLTFERDRKVMRGAGLSVILPQPAPVTCDANGDFTTDIIPGIYYVRATAGAAGVSIRQALQVPSQESALFGDLLLVPDDALPDGLVTSLEQAIIDSRDEVLDAQARAEGLNALFDDLVIQRENQFVDTASAHDPNLLDDPLFLNDYEQLFGIPVTRFLSPTGIPGIKIADGVSNGLHNLTCRRDRIAGDTFNAGITVWRTENTKGRILVSQYDADGNEISASREDYDDLPQNVGLIPITISLVDKPIAATCTEIRIRIGSGTGIEVAGAYIRRQRSAYTPVGPAEVNSRLPAYLSATGDDLDLGTVSSPFATIKAAVLAGHNHVIVKDSGGVYTDGALDIDGDWFTGPLTVSAVQQHMPRQQSGFDLTGWTATAGRTDVYEVTDARPPETQNKGFLFIKDVPFDLISDADRHTLHRGRSHRCPHYLMKPVNSIANVEAATEASWFYDTGDGKYYVKAAAGVDPLAMTITVPNGTAIRNLSSNHQLKIVGITYEFALLRLDKCGFYDLTQVESFGSPSDAFSMDQTHGRDTHCIALAPSNDGWNAHNSSDGSGAARSDGRTTIGASNHSTEPWSAWAYDDCRSDHERCVGYVQGGLYEFGGSTGCAPASGAEVTLDGTLIRDPGWQGGSQAGVDVTNDPLDDGAKTVALCRGVTVKRAVNGFMTSFPESLLELHDTRTFDCTGTALLADDVGSTIRYHNHIDSGTPTKKGGAGALIPDNGELVT